jgi:hypothetical protein
VGITLIGFGLYRNSNYALVAGSVESALFLPAMRWAWKIRRENIAIRLLEAALRRPFSQITVGFHLSEDENRNTRSHALRGNAVPDALRRPGLASLEARVFWLCEEDAERPRRHSHAERGNE